MGINNLAVIKTLYADHPASHRVEGGRHIEELPDDVLTSIFAIALPESAPSIAATCRHFFKVICLSKHIAIEDVGLISRKRRYEETCNELAVLTTTECCEVTEGGKIDAIGLSFANAHANKRRRLDLLSEQADRVADPILSSLASKGLLGEYSSYEKLLEAKEYWMREYAPRIVAFELIIESPHQVTPLLASALSSMKALKEISIIASLGTLQPICELISKLPLQLQKLSILYGDPRRFMFGNVFGEEILPVCITRLRLKELRISGQICLPSE
jgi:hypothetical protein